MPNRITLCLAFIAATMDSCFATLIYYEDFSSPNTTWHKYEGSSHATSHFETISTPKGNALQISVTSLSQPQSWSLVYRTIESFSLPDVPLDQVYLTVDCETNIPGRRFKIFHFWSYSDTGITGKLDFTRLDSDSIFTLGGLLSEGNTGLFDQGSDRFMLGIRFQGTFPLPEDDSYWMRIYSIKLETIPEPATMFLLGLAFSIFAWKYSRTRRCS